MKDVQIRWIGCGEVLEAKEFIEDGSGKEVIGQDRIGVVTGLAWDPCRGERAFRTGFMKGDWARAESPGWSQESGRLGLLGLRCTMYMSVAQACGKQRLSVGLGIQDWVSLDMTYLFLYFKFFYGEETQQLF